MASRASLLVRPGAPDTPEFIDINCSGLDNTKTVELLVNDVVRTTVSVEQTGEVTSTYNVPAGEVRNALVDLNYCHSSFDIPGEVLCRMESSLNDSMELRYQS